MVFSSCPDLVNLQINDIIQGSSLSELDASFLDRLESITIGSRRDATEPLVDAIVDPVDLPTVLQDLAKTSSSLKDLTILGPRVTSVPTIQLLISDDDDPPAVLSTDSLFVSNVFQPLTELNAETNDCQQPLMTALGLNKALESAQCLLHLEIIFTQPERQHIHSHPFDDGLFDNIMEEERAADARQSQGIRKAIQAIADGLIEVCPSLRKGSFWISTEGSGARVASPFFWEWRLNDAPGIGDHVVAKDHGIPAKRLKLLNFGEYGLIPLLRSSRASC